MADPMQAALLEKAKRERAKRSAPEITRDQAQAAIDGRNQFFGDFATALNKAGESMTFGLVGDETSAAFDAMIGRGDYDERLKHYQDTEADFDERHPVASVAADLLPAAIPGAGAAKLISKVPTLAGKAAASAGIGAAAGGVHGFMEADGGDRVKGAQTGGLLGGVIGGAVPVASSAAQGILSGGAKRAARRKLNKAAPSQEALKASAEELYQLGEQTGQSAPGGAVKDLITEFKRTLVKSGALSPKGTITGDFPNVRQIMRAVEDYADDGMTPEQMNNFRQALQNAAGSTNAREQRLGKLMKDQFAEWVEPRVPEFAEANAKWSKVAKSKKLQQMQELAENDASSNYTRAGMEHGLRKRYSQLLRDIIKGKEKGYSPEEVDMIRSIANGGTAENIARGVGKYAPTGPLAAATSFGAPALVAQAFGLPPGVGAALGTAAWGAGTSARKLATNMQMNKVGLLDSMVRSGQTPQANPKQIKGILDMLSLGGATTAPQQDLPALVR